MAFTEAFRGKRVLLTGHTGFKGAWLAEWLLALGAQVTGYSLSNPDNRLFAQLELTDRLRHVVGDIRDLTALRKVVEDTSPDFVFHLAAQPLVLRSYCEPVETYATNVIGTVNLLEAVRVAADGCVIVAVTTDKCYENSESGRSYEEGDPMGGHDPYSSSKGAAELVISAYRRSYFSDSTAAVRLASARAGNVIGGGDWAADRIVPDCIRALVAHETIRIRNRNSVRPWQHVLEPLSGYLTLAERLHSRRAAAQGDELASAFNFGPSATANRTVGELVEEILRHWPGRWSDAAETPTLHEARLLALATEKARRLLQWEPIWSFEQTIAHTVNWYREVEANPRRARDMTQSQITQYVADARMRGIGWSI